MRSVLMSGPGYAVSLWRHDGDRQQALHRDQRSRISLVLSGGFREEGPSGSARLGPGELLIKSRTVLHEDAYSPDGATLLTVELDEDDSRLAHIRPDSWRQRQDAAAIRMSAMILKGVAARNVAVVEIACADLLADQDADARRSAPAWLLRLKDEIEAAGIAAVDVAACAREAGVHPAHASRLFRQCFGASITEHARTHAVRRAIALMACPGAGLADVALAAGFCDQSHMSRAFRRVAGHTPGTHRALVMATARFAESRLAG